MLPDIVENGKLFSSVTAERGMSFRHLVTLKTIFSPVEGGYRLSGRKISASIGEHADYYFTTGFLEGKKTAAEAIMTAVLHKDYGGSSVGGGVGHHVDAGNGERRHHLRGHLRAE